MAYKSVRIPNEAVISNRDIIYIDESGVADLNDKKTKYFILTGVITDSELFKKYNSYYCQLKYKYLGDDVAVHSYDLFYKPGKYKKKFIEELSIFIDNIPFGFFTIVANKTKLLSSVPNKKINDPLSTTFRKAISIYTANNKTQADMYTAPVSEVISEISKYKIQDINRYYALEVTYRELLEQYFNKYTPAVNTTSQDFELCFEESPNKKRILEITEKLKNSGTSLAQNLNDNFTGISFPYKRAKYLGLELADIIAFGFNLSLYGKASTNLTYSKIWEAINKRRIEFKNKKKIDMLVKP